MNVVYPADFDIKKLRINHTQDRTIYKTKRISFSYGTSSGYKEFILALPKYEYVTTGKISDEYTMKEGPRLSEVKKVFVFFNTKTEEQLEMQFKKHSTREDHHQRFIEVCFEVRDLVARELEDKEVEFYVMTYEDDPSKISVPAKFIQFGGEVKTIMKEFREDEEGNAKYRVIDDIEEVARRRVKFGATFAAAIVTSSKVSLKMYLNTVIVHGSTMELTDITQDLD